MKSVLLAVLCFFCLSDVLFAQSNTPLAVIKGTVIDSASNKPLGYVTVALNDAKTNQPVKSTLTKDDGKFELIKLPAKNYHLVLVFVGYNSKTINIDLDKGSADLGRLVLSPSKNELKAVSVTAVKPIIKQEVDRITYDIQADPENKVLNVLDMMRKVPLLSLDADDNIKLNGNGNYKILINGKPSSLVARDPKDVFRAMPASSIEKIEVITTPPAKYDSEGLAGIINIITKKKVDNGYNGSINISDRFPVGGPGVGGSFTVKEGKFGASAYFGGSEYNQPTTENSSTRNTTDSPPTTLVQSGHHDSKNKFGYMGAELSYEIDSLNLLTLEFNPNGGNYHSNQYQSSVTTLTNTDSIIQRYTNTGLNKSSNSGFDIGLNYQLGFKRNKQQLLTVSYKYNIYNNRSTNNLDITDRINYPTADYKQFNHGQAIEQTAQVDYVHPLKSLTIEGGLKGILRNNNSNFEYDSLDATSGNYYKNLAQSNQYQNDQYILGAYNSYTYNYQSWAFKGGARLEETIIDADFVSSSTNLRQHYLNLIPSLSINRKLKNNINLNLGFTQRIQRPDIGDLNPFVDRSNPSFQSTGNPDLRPVLTNAVQFGFSKFKKASLNILINYNFANNTIQQVSTYDPVSQVTLSRYQNIGHTHALGGNVSINYPITKKWSINVNGNLNYLWLQGIVNGAEAKNSGLQGYAFAYTGYRFDDGWRINVNYSYSAPYLTLQTKTSSYNFSALSASKEIIKNKLTVSGSVQNPFMKYKNYVSHTDGGNFTQTSYSQNYYRRFAVSVNYRFGKLKSDIKKNQRSINNDDKSGGSSSSSNQ